MASIDWSEILGEKDINIPKSGIKKIIRRDGTVDTYKPEKIANAISKAIEAVRGVNDLELDKKLTELTEKKLEEFQLTRHPNSIPAIEEIQDLVETTLIEAKEVDIAKAYILYRSRHEAIRDQNKLMLDIDETMDGYLSQSDWRVNENANVNFSLGGLILHNSGTITANYWLKNIYTKEIAEAHKTGAFHIHDLSMFSGYCAGWSLRQLIKDGLGGVSEKITSKPATHLSTLMFQIVNFLGIMQNEWAGAQALSSFDTFLAPFIRADKLTYSQVKQAVQSFIFGVNTPSRWGSQAPFTNITLDWVCPTDLVGKKAIVGGKEQDYTYDECTVEMELINKAFLELMLEGDANGRGFAYPIPTYNITPDFDWETNNAKLLFEITAKYGTPYFQNFVNSDLNPEDVRSMCCRLQLDKRELRKRGGGLFGSDELTGSIGVVTINLPRVGYLSNTKEEFYQNLGHMMDLAASSLVLKRKVVNKMMDNGLFPYTKKYLKNMNSHFSTIGLVGMNECLKNYISTDLTTSEGQDTANEILVFMRDRLADYQEKTGDLYNLEATPAESTSYRLAKHDKKFYPNIITAGEDDPYYTNSTQLPVDFTRDIFEALDLQDALQTKYTGGTVFHGMLGEAIKDWKACRKLVQTISANYKLPFFSISPIFSICSVHGYLSGAHDNCPKCKDDEKMKINKQIEELKKQKLTNGED